MLFIAGDLFHRQPLMRELKEVNAMFAALTHTKVVMIAGNHDYMKRDSYYRTFSWCGQVSMLAGSQLQVVEFPGLQTAVYGLSYHEKEIVEGLYDNAARQGRQTYEVLLAHGGDNKHIPIKRNKLMALGYDYVALGHIHKPGELIKGRAVYAGALEPIDKNDVGEHGYVKGEITKQGVRLSFVPFAKRKYIHAEVPVTEQMTNHEVKEQIRECIRKQGTRHLYKLILQGFRDADMEFDTVNMDPFGNVLEIVDETIPAYDYEKLKQCHKDNLLGKFIRSMEGYEEGSIEQQALCEGVRALLETRRGLHGN